MEEDRADRPWEKEFRDQALVCVCVCAILRDQQVFSVLGVPSIGKDVWGTK